MRIRPVRRRGAEPSWGEPATSDGTAGGRRLRLGGLGALVRISFWMSSLVLPWVVIPSFFAISSSSWSPDFTNRGRDAMSMGFHREGQRLASGATPRHPWAVAAATPEWLGLLAPGQLTPVRTLLRLSMFPVVMEV